jgi:hypothetical protein
VNLIIYVEQYVCANSFVDTHSRAIANFDHALIKNQLASLLSLYWRSQGDQ